MYCNSFTAVELTALGRLSKRNLTWEDPTENLKQIIKQMDLKVVY